MKNGGGPGQLMQKHWFVCKGATQQRNRPWLFFIPFKIYLESFPIQKQFTFLFFSPYKSPDNADDNPGKLR